MPAHIERLLEAACSAPSHDNSQPWRFLVDGETVAFMVDLEGSGGDLASSRIAVGAAVECACISAARMGATVRFGEPRAGALVEMTVTAPKRLADPDLSRKRRVTNRRIYDGRALDDSTLKALRDATPKRDYAQTHWFGRERVRALAPLVEQAEEILFTDTALRDRTLAALRFDVKDKDTVERGLPVGSLEASTAERTALATLRKPAGEGAVAAARRTLALRARKQMESASGVCIVTTAGSDPMADVDAGRAMQRAWMTLTQKGMAAHPMMAILSLALVAALPDADTLDQRLMPLLTSFREAFPNVPDDTRVALLMRIGWADAPSCRTGRRPLEELIVR